MFLRSILGVFDNIRSDEKTKTVKRLLMRVQLKTDWASEKSRILEALFNDVLSRIPFEAYQAMTAANKTRIDDFLVKAFTRLTLQENDELNRIHGLIQLEKTLFKIQRGIGRIIKSSAVSDEKANVESLEPIPLLTAKWILASVTGGMKSEMSFNIEKLSEASDTLADVIEAGISYSTYVKADENTKEKARQMIIDKLTLIAKDYENIFITHLTKTTYVKEIRGGRDGRSPMRVISVPRETKEGASTDKKMGITQDLHQHELVADEKKSVDVHMGVYRFPRDLFFSPEELDKQLEETFAAINGLLQPKLAGQSTQGLLMKLDPAFKPTDVVATLAPAPVCSGLETHQSQGLVEVDEEDRPVNQNAPGCGLSS